MEPLHRAQERIRRLQPRCRVVIPAGHHDLEMGHAPPRFDEEPVPEGLRLVWRVRGVEHVARDEDRIDGLALDRVEEPVNELPVLVGPFDAMEGVPQVPVGRVKEAQRHRERRIRRGRTRESFRSCCASRPARIGPRKPIGVWRSPSGRSGPAVGAAELRQTAG